MDPRSSGGRKAIVQGAVLSRQVAHCYNASMLASRISTSDTNARQACFDTAIVGDNMECKNKKKHNNNFAHQVSHSIHYCKGQNSRSLHV